MLSTPAILVVMLLLTVGFIYLIKTERERQRRSVNNDGGILDYTLTARLMSIVGLFLILFIAYLGLNGSQDKFYKAYGLTEAIIVFIGNCIIIPAAAYWLFFESFFDKIVYGPDGIMFRSPWRPNCFIAWRDVEFVTFIGTGLSLKVNGLTLVDNKGLQRKVRTFYYGFPAFVIYAESHLPEQVVSKSREALDAAREYAFSQQHNREVV